MKISTPKDYPLDFAEKRKNTENNKTKRYIDIYIIYILYIYYYIYNKGFGHFFSRFLLVSKFPLFYKTSKSCIPFFFPFYSAKKCFSEYSFFPSPNFIQFITFSSKNITFSSKRISNFIYFAEVKLYLVFQIYSTIFSL